MCLLDLNVPLMDELMARYSQRINFFGPNGCWVWQGQANNWGYGVVAIHQVKQPVHRVFYELFVGEIPEEYVVDHTCRNRLCVNPLHLQAITKNENVALGGTRKTHCPQGHEYTEANTYRTKNGRQCNTCRSIRSKAQAQARKALV